MMSRTAFRVGLIDEMDAHAGLIESIRAGIENEGDVIEDVDVEIPAEVLWDMRNVFRMAIASMSGTRTKKKRLDS